MLIELDAWQQNSKFRPKASLLEGFPQRGRAAARPAPFEVCGGRPKAASFMEAGFRLEFGVLLPDI